MSRTAASFSTAPVAHDSNRPKLRSPDLSRSYQWPFHLRVHPDRWEFVNGEWRLDIERVHLRPGVAGVGGKPTDLSTIRDGKLKEAWAEHGDRRWVLVGNGDKRIDANGFSFLDKVEVSVDDRGKLIEGSILVASWEILDSAGNIVNDEAKLTEVSKLLASKLWGLEGPTDTARRAVSDGLRKTLNQLCETAARKPTVSPSLSRRITKLKDKYKAVTGEDYDDGLPKPAPAPAPTASPEVALLQQLLALPAAERAALLNALSPATAPAAPPPAAPPAPPQAPPAPTPQKHQHPKGARHGR